MLDRKSVYQFTAMAVFVLALVAMGSYQRNGRTDTDAHVPSAAQAIYHSSSMSLPAQVIVNQYGWYTDGASNTGPDIDAREH